MSDKLKIYKAKSSPEDPSCIIFAHSSKEAKVIFYIEFDPKWIDIRVTLLKDDLYYCFADANLMKTNTPHAYTGNGCEKCNEVDPWEHDGLCPSCARGYED